MASISIPAAADLWNVQRIEQLAPDEASVVAARKVLKKGGFEQIERTADGRGWWAYCQGLTGKYQVSARRTADRLDWDCSCPSPKRPCKHAIALLIYLAETPSARPEPKADAAEPTADDFEPLLRGVFANPADDTVRLVFADWLDDHGEPDRAALVRVQCESARTTLKAKRGKELAAEEKRLNQSIRGVIGPIPDGFDASFRRGFIDLKIEHFAVWKPGTLPAGFPDLFRRGWVEAVRFTGMTSSVPRDAVPYLLQVREVDFSKSNFSDAELVGLAADLPVGSPGNRLATVTLRPVLQKRYDAAVQGRIAVAAPAWLHGTPFHGVTVARLEALAKDGHLRDLPFQFEGGLDDVGAEFLARSPESAAAEYLLAPEGDLTDAGAAALGRSTTMVRVATVDVSGNPITAAGLTALLAGGGLPALQSVRAWRLLARPDEWLAAVVDSGRDNLQVEFDDGVLVSRTATSRGLGIVVHSHGAAVPGLFDRFAESHTAKAVRAVSLFRFRFEPADLDRLGKTFGPADLTIRHSVLRNRHVLPLAANLDRLRPEVLDLSDNEIGVAGAEALAGSPGMAGVRELVLSHNPLRLAGLKAIASSPHFDKLERLELRNTGEGKLPVHTPERDVVRHLLPDRVAVVF